MTDDQTIPLADLDAHGVLDLYGAASPDIDSVALNYVDDRTILAVGYGAVIKGRRMATGRVAWLMRGKHRWQAEQIETGRHRGIGRMSSYDDLAALVAWLKGGE